MCGLVGFSGKADTSVLKALHLLADNDSRGGHSTGMFVNGKRHGYGKLYNENTELIFEGTFIKGKKDYQKEKKLIMKLSKIPNWGWIIFLHQNQKQIDLLKNQNFKKF